MHTTKIAISIVFTGCLVAGIIVLARSGGISSSENQIQQGDIQNVSIVDGKQIIDLRVKGGYSPRVSVAKAGIPTSIRFNTSSTFDCSASVRIPSLNLFQILPQTGSTSIDLGVQKVGTLQGSCGMGMYPFQIQFQ